MAKKPCPFCGELLQPGWSDHRCPEVTEALDDLRAAAGLEDNDDSAGGDNPTDPPDFDGPGCTDG